MSTENCQDDRVVYSNTRMLFDKIKPEIEAGIMSELDSENAQSRIREILDVSDDDAKSYWCGTALFMLWKLAKEENSIYDRALDASGHWEK